ncbi:L-threonylcarbamoyladenylate synthase [Nocardioides sp.]|uniref:L-threonylcarbamoyladenylate synthase n=1 Tax=Nocardioides sp. TaxID=35761 RepID=UPI003528E62A
MSVLFSVDSPQEREAALQAAVRAISRGRLVVMPTDTVYGLAADAFEPEAVERLLAAKGRGREMPPPVLISAVTTVDALAVGLPEYARALIDEFWPGPLTIVARQQPSLQWDLGDTRGTVAIRMPDHELAREILERTGPLAVSSANTTGRPPATTAVEADEMLGEDVQLIIDGGPTPGVVPSTIVAVTGTRPKVLREGALSAARLDEVLTPLGWSVGEPAADPDAADPDAVDDSGETDAASDEGATPDEDQVSDGDGD